MNGKKQMIERLYEMAEPIAEMEGFEVLDIEIVGKRDMPRVQVTLFDPDGGGPTIGDCQKFNQSLGARLDFEEDFLPEGFSLEVSSPGLERVLKNPREFEAFTGKKVQVRTYAPIDGAKEFYGLLGGLDGDDLLLQQDEGVRRIPRDKVSRTKLVFEL